MGIGFNLHCLKNMAIHGTLTLRGFLLHFNWCLSWLKRVENAGKCRIPFTDASVHCECAYNRPTWRRPALSTASLKGHATFPLHNGQRNGTLLEPFFAIKIDISHRIINTRQPYNIQIHRVSRKT